MHVTTQLRDFILANYVIPANTQLEDIASFLGDGVIDSTGVLELVSFIEARFGVKVRDDELVPANFDSLVAVASFVERKLTAP